MADRVVLNVQGTTKHVADVGGSGEHTHMSPETQLGLSDEPITGVYLYPQLGRRGT
jgi:hypothetical protein